VVILMRYLSIVAGILLFTILALMVYLKLLLPNVGPPPDITVELTHDRIEHGRYLANHVMLCMDCHAVRDFSLFGGPPNPESLGSGGEHFGREMGLPGEFVTPNLTPSALGDWTDGEIFRAIVSGVSRDGTALFPLMPYPHYSQLDEEDIYAVIAYIRTLNPVETSHPARKLDFPVSLLVNTMPVRAEMQSRPEHDDPVSYGRYLITAAACTDCHTKMERGQYVGTPYGGGNEYILPDGSVVRAANITPHETGIGNWTKEQFVTRFKAFSKETNSPRRVEPGQFQTIMPWPMYAEMKREDLEAIYEYLRTIEPADNRVTLFSPAD
jgi:hypothetical protein